MFHSLVLHSKSKVGMGVLVGTDKLKRGGRFFKAKDFFVHDDYKPERKMRRAGDIAVILIVGNFHFDDKVQPIELSPIEANNGDDASE